MCVTPYIEILKVAGAICKFIFVSLSFVIKFIAADGSFNAALSLKF